MRYNANVKKYVKDKKITILKETRKPGPYAEYEYTPIHDGQLWAYFRHLSGAEFWAAMAVNVDEDVLFIVNWRNDIDHDCVVKFKDKYYTVTRIDNFEGYKSDIKLYCKYDDYSGRYE